MADAMRRQHLINILCQIGGDTAKGWAGRLQNALCPFCGKGGMIKEDFRDESSWKEFKLSHMCQQCQDETFGPV